MKQKPIRLALLPSYLAFINNSVGSKLFRNRFYLINNRPLDVLENGNLSCAYFVSSILYHFGLIRTLHTTVKGTSEDLMKSDWIEIAKPRIGCVLIWKNKYFTESGNWHKHIGFYLGKQKAISTSSKAGTPIVHHWKKNDITGEPRNITKMLWHKELESKNPRLRRG